MQDGLLAGGPSSIKREVSSIGIAKKSIDMLYN
jgi:hypothetical protein